jgi:hypothetical protein
MPAGREPGSQGEEGVVAMVMRAIAVALVLSLAGCAMSVPLPQPDTLCQLPRPRANINDTITTRDSQAEAAKVWDRKCTLLGAWR